MPSVVMPNVIMLTFVMSS